MKICVVGVELLHADGQTGVTKLIFAFRGFANVLGICCKHSWFLRKLIFFGPLFFFSMD